MRIKTGKFLIGKRINIVIILTVLLLFVTIAIPSFCMLLMKDNSNEIEYWDGTIATSYNSGTGEEEDPYIIKTPEQLSLVFIMGSMIFQFLQMPFQQLLIWIRLKI